MTCIECEKAQENSVCYPFRWKIATILIIVCKKHAKEIIDILKKVQIVQPL